MTTNIIEIETNISQLTTELSGFSPRIFHEDPPVGGTDVDIQLLEAAKAGDMAVVEKLILANQHSVNCRDLDGRHSTPLHVAAGYNRVTVVDFLLKHGADVHAKDKGALVPLHNACSYGHYEVTELLIKHKADVNVADLWKFTPLHEAAAEGKLEICKLLLKHGADATKKNKDGNTPLDLVKEGDNDVANLLRGDAALLEAAEKGKSSQVQKLTTQENINCRDNQGRNSTPLHTAGLEIKKEGRTSPNRTKFRKLSREVCGEVCDIPENNSVIFVYEKRPSKVSLIGEISYQFCDLKMDSPGSNFDSEFYSQITFMFVKEDFQLQGIGKKLVKKVLNEFKSHDKSRPIRIQSAGRAVGFFEKLGFVKVGDIMETVCGISVFRFMQNMERPIPSPT